MSDLFDSDIADQADDERSGMIEQLDESVDGMYGDEAFADGGDFATEDESFAPLPGDAVDGVDDMMLWDAFEEEVADGLDATSDDEFIGRLLGGLGRAAGVLSRGLGGAGGVAGQIGSFANRAGEIAGGVGRVARAVSPAADTAARLARILGAPGAANALGQVSRLAQGVGQAAGRAQGIAGSLGQTASSAQGLFSQIGQLLGQGNNADDAFDAVMDLYLDDGLDEALPAAVALAARAAARGLGYRNVAQLSLAGRRALVRGVAAAARELSLRRGPQAVRLLPRLAVSAARVAQQQVPTPQQAVQVVRRGLPRAAQRLTQSPAMVRRLSRQPATAPLARPRSPGRDLPIGGRRLSRSIRVSGPATLTINLC